jgi:hypothetical protein
MVHPLERSGDAPRGEMPLVRGEGLIFRRKIAPLATGSEKAEDGLEQQPPRPLQRPSRRRRDGKKMFDHACKVNAHTCHPKSAAQFGLSGGFACGFRLSMPTGIGLPHAIFVVPGTVLEVSGAEVMLPRAIS